jgi:Fe2+ transport system protein B
VKRDYNMPVIRNTKLFFNHLKCNFYSFELQNYLESMDFVVGGCGAVVWVVPLLKMLSIGSNLIVDVEETRSST